MLSESNLARCLASQLPDPHVDPGSVGEVCEASISPGVVDNTDGTQGGDWDIHPQLRVRVPEGQTPIIDAPGGTLDLSH